MPKDEYGFIFWDEIEKELSDPKTMAKTDFFYTIIAHELGHNFGLWHPEKASKGCKATFKDVDNIMKEVIPTGNILRKFQWDIIQQNE